MSLLAPAQAPIKHFKDINGKIHYVGNGKPTLLAFFRDANCPFCHYRLHELVMHYDELKKQGVQVLVVFAAEKAEIEQFVKVKKTPFPLISDADLSLHHTYEIESANVTKLYLMTRYLLKMIKGMMLVGVMNAMKSTSKILPADFLIDRDGTIKDVFYSDDYAERMPLENILSFSQVEQQIQQQEMKKHTLAKSYE